MKLVITEFSGEYSYLSNFYAAPLKFMVGGVNEVIFPTNEHAFQACKYKANNQVDGVKYIDSILAAKTPGEAKKLGRQIPIDLDKWEAIKIDCMREIVFQKFEQHVDLRAKLLDTGAAMLVEGNRHNDTYWGRCNGRGYNILGSILMECRGYWYWKNNVCNASRNE